MSPEGASPREITQIDRFGEGDAYLVHSILPNEIATGAFQKIKDEVLWQTMHHHGEYRHVIGLHQ